VWRVCVQADVLGDFHKLRRWEFGATNKRQIFGATDNRIA